jgi:hypothetical protein
LREQAGQIRQEQAPAVRASWKADWARSLGLSVVVALFLSLVGAFGSNVAPLGPRTLFFVLFGLGAGVIVACSISVSGWIPGLRAWSLARRVVVGLLATVLVGLWVWAVLGIAFLHGPKLAMLPQYLGYSLLMSVFMSVISWAVYRERSTVVVAAAAAEPPKFLARLPARLWGAEVYAVEAEDHYLRLHTSKGSDLILMRLSDAIVELEGLEGARTHRSWWVAKAGVADVRRSDGRATLALKDGSEAPVSRTCAKALRQMGWL